MISLNPKVNIFLQLINHPPIHLSNFKMTSAFLQQLTTGQLSHSGIVQHLSNLIRQSITTKSQLQGMSNLQIFSYYLRKNKFSFQQLMQDHQLNYKMNQQRQQSDYVRNVNKLVNRIKELNNRKVYARPNIVEEYHVLKQCGISVGETNCVHLANVLKTIATDYQCSNVRFWGKMLGYNDYYVIQGQSTKKYLNDLPPEAEPYGTGANTYSYWVANSILGQWVELPLITPTQLKQSRNFKYIFTGNLEQQVHPLSQFSGKQKHLLKCILARITHSCELVPKGLYKTNEENPSLIEFEEEFKIPEVADMNSLDNWVHLNAHILNQGRASYYVDPKLNEEEKEALNTQLAETDPIVERLKTITEDKPYEALGYTANWTVQLCGQTIPINLIGKQQGQSALYASVLLKNLVWPGASTVGYRGGWTNIYIGYGQRISQINSLIKQLDNLQLEGQTKKQYPEPNPKQQPQVVVEEKQNNQELSVADDDA